MARLLPWAATGGALSRVTQGGCPPRVPTDPGLRLEGPESHANQELDNVDTKPSLSVDSGFSDVLSWTLRARVGFGIPRSRFGFVEDGGFLAGAF